MSFNPIPYDFWRGLLHWGIIAGGFFVGLLVIALMTSLLVGGRRGLRSTLKVIGEVFRDWLTLSPQRVGAMCMLTFRESVRRKALLVFVIFALLFMFAGWFLADSGQRDDLQVKVYVSFVLRTISWLVLPVAMLLSCWSLPDDIKARSLHTVVTKPVRRNEVVLGRILGFVLIGTLVLSIMGTVGYVWLYRQLSGSARDSLTCRVPIYGTLTFIDREGVPTARGINTGDTWDFRSYIDGATKATAIWQYENVTPEAYGDELKFEHRFEAFRTHKGEMGEGLIARLFFANPIRSNWAKYIKESNLLREFRDSVSAGQWDTFAGQLDQLAGQIESESTDIRRKDLLALADPLREVADELRPLTERFSDQTWLTTIIQDNEAAAAAADEASSSDIASALRKLAESIRANKSGLNEFVVDLRVPHKPFRVREFRHEDAELVVNRELSFFQDGKPTKVDLYESVVHGGRLQVEVQCLEAGQLIGMARPDLFIKAPDRPFRSGYTKAVVGIWLMMVLIVVVGVSASTFLKGPVATLLTFVFLIVGTAFRDFVDRLIAGELKGSGAVESAIRLGKHLNPSVDLNVTGEQAVKAVDTVLSANLYLVNVVIPDFTPFGRTAEFVANGFDVPFAAGMLPCIMTTLAYLIPCLVLGQICLKVRELEAK